MANVRYIYSNWRQNPVRQTVKAASSRYVLFPLVIVLIIVTGILTYYYNIYTKIIDARLSGDIFVRSSGIYAAPLTLNSNARMRQIMLLNHLRKIGYLEKGSTQNEKRGQFEVRGNVVEIIPGSDAIIDGQPAFHKLSVSFGRDAASIQSITDLDTNRRVQEAQVEPELISSVVNNDREKRKNIEYKDLPDDLISAIVATEDRQFFSHPGINWRGIARALWTDYQTGQLKEGGSSITQQLVKNFFLKPDKTLKRKLSEAYMSILLEQKLNKEEIMAMYCNQIYLGQRGGFSINGFGQAARAYFGKDISQLNLEESAFLAGIIQSPNRYSPWTDRDRAIKRRNDVLNKMVDADKITQAAAEDAKQRPLVVTTRGSGDVTDAPYFIDYLMRGIEETQYDPQTLYSMRIYSTIDLELQRAAYNAISRNMPAIEKSIGARRKGRTAGLQASLVALNANTGEILAMVGGRDYTSSQLNRAVDARRQPGSIFKPFVYAAGIELGLDGESTAITPATTFMDEPHTFSYDGREWTPGNFGDQFELRPITVREALYKSKNVITVSIAERIGFSQVSRFAEKAGFTKVPALPSVSLGTAEATPLQLASAYTAFAHGGKRTAPISIKRITGKDGETIVQPPRPDVRNVMSPQTAYIVTSILQDVLDKGTGTKVRQMGFNGIAAGKTGTSRDGWFAGYTPNIVCVVWVGFDDNSDIQVTGGATAALIWADFMKFALQMRPEMGGKFEPPAEGLVTYNIDAATGEPAQTDAENVREEIFLRGTEPGTESKQLDEQNGTTDPAKTDESKSGETSPPQPSDATYKTDTETDGYAPPTRKRRVNEEPETERREIADASSTSKRPSFFTRLGRALGITTTTNIRPKPAPTPWTTGGLKPIPKEQGRIRDSTPPTKSNGQNGKAKLEPAVASAPSVTRSKPTPFPFVGKQSRNNQSSKEIPKPQATPNIVAKPAATPPPVATVSPPPTLGPTQKGSFILEICNDHPERLAVEGLCPRIIKKRFKLGDEPTRSCSTKLHRGKI